MGYGFKNAPPVFQRALEKTLNNCHRTFCYIDDIYIIQPNDQTNFQELVKVFGALIRDGWILRLDKCKFFQPSVEHLGRHVDYRGIKQEAKHIQKIINFGEIKNKKDIMSFLGLVNWIGSFNNNILKYKNILSRLRRKNTNFKKSYGKEEKDAVEKIKAIVKYNTNKLLYHPSPKLRYCIDIDSSKMGYGATVYQISRSKIYPIHHLSSLWPSTMQRWHSTELETAAIIKTIDKLSPYFLSKDKAFFLFSDCQAAISNIKRGNTGKNTKFARWASFLMSYKFILIHKKGVNMGITDYLSRLGYEQTTKDPTIQAEINDITQQYKMRWMVNKLIPTPFQQEIDDTKDELEFDEYDKDQSNAIFRKWDEIQYPSDDESTATIEDLEHINELYSSKFHYNYNHVNPQQFEPEKVSIMANNPNYI